MNHSPASLSPCPACAGTGRKDVGPNHWVQCSVCEGKRPAASTPREVPPQRWPFYVLAAYVIVTCLWRAVVPAHEYPMRSTQVMKIIFDLLAVGALIGVRVTTFRGKNRLDGVGGALFWVALAAGLGLFVIRATSDASWWTGHLRYEGPPVAFGPSADSPVR